MTRPIAEQTVVITGATSGIGRETARYFAEHGASVVVAARSAEVLNEVVRECEDEGARALAVVTDVARWEDVERLAHKAAEWNGRIDTWINNAAVNIWSSVEDLSVQEIERVIQVDLLGMIYGMKAVLPIMKGQHEGTIINVTSVEAERSLPLQAAYTAAKHGVKGFSDSLRMEMEHEHTGVNVTVVYPASINTPLFSHSRSKMGVKARPVPPVYEPRVVARALLHAARHPQREIFVGGAGKAMSFMEHLAPRLTDVYMSRKGRMFRQQRTDEPAPEHDNLFGPLEEQKYAVRGEFSEGAHKRSLFTSLFELHPGRKSLALGALALAAGAALYGAGRGQSAQSKPTPPSGPGADISSGDIIGTA